MCSAEQRGPSSHLSIHKASMTSILPMHDAEMTFWGEGGGLPISEGTCRFWSMSLTAVAADDLSWMRCSHPQSRVPRGFLTDVIPISLLPSGCVQLLVVYVVQYSWLNLGGPIPGQEDPSSPVTSSMFHVRLFPAVLHDTSQTETGVAPPCLARSLGLRSICPSDCCYY